MIITLLFMVMNSHGTTSPTQEAVPEGAKSERIAEVKVSAELEDIGALTRGMAFIAIPEEEKSLRIKYDLPSASDAIDFGAHPSGRHTYDINSKTNMSWTIENGRLIESVNNVVRWQAPMASGDFKLRLTRTEERRWGKDDTLAPLERYVGQLDLTALVQFPFNASTQSAVEGYPIGVYPDESAPSVGEPVASHRDAYRPPKFMVKVTPLNEHLYVSEHFTLGDFSRPDEKGKTRFIALQYPLLRRLERIIDLLNEGGKRVDHLTILRGYISPLEKDRLEREGVSLSDFSRFLYGDAVAFIVDQDGDKKMDDLNGDGRIDIADAEFLADIAEQAEVESKLPGGIGVYSNFTDPFFQNTPYIQVDTRGWRSRWSFINP